MVFLHHRILDFHDESLDFWGASHHGSEKERWMIPIPIEFFSTFAAAILTNIYHQ